MTSADFFWEVVKALPQALLPMLVKFWPAFALLGAMFLVVGAFRLYEYRRLARSGISNIDRMSGVEFEGYLEVLFQRLGYQRVERTEYYDYGADLIAYKDGVKTAIQAKRSAGKVGVAAVQQVVAAKAKYRCSHAVVVTNGEYTRQARHLAMANDVELWDRKALAEQIQSLRKKESTTVVSEHSGIPAPTVVDVTLTDEQLAPAAEAGLSFCATCGIPVAENVKRYCLSNPRIFAGRVYCFDHQEPFKRATRL